MAVLPRVNMDMVLDEYNGVVIEPASIPNDRVLFLAELQRVMGFVAQEQKNIVWLTLPLSHAFLVDIATDMGFEFHNCLPQQLTLIHRPSAETFVPFVPTHTVGVGALIVREGALLVVKERRSQGYKLPSGQVDLAESLASAVRREVMEETGIETRFGSIVAISTKHPFQFGKSNIYVICQLQALSEAIEVHDQHEIEEACWVHHVDYLSDEKNPTFHRHLVERLISAQGLEWMEHPLKRGDDAQRELFFMR
ncbi:MAG: NUDIX domain-containing protein [Zetaproteobacteria bacterium]|nr:NUDIX domain-containing protein [Zetaproteobacteria bacterium]